MNDQIMPRLTIISPGGQSHQIDATPGSTLMEAIRGAGVDELLALCGGCCSCATCHVHIAPSFLTLLPEVGVDEDDLLESSEARTEFSRLSCQITVTSEMDGLSATVIGEE